MYGDILRLFEDVNESLIYLLEEKLSEKQVTVVITVQVGMSKENAASGETQYASPYFRTKAAAVLHLEDIHEVLQLAYSTIEKKVQTLLYHTAFLVLSV